MKANLFFSLFLASGSFSTLSCSQMSGISALIEEFDIQETYRIQEVCNMQEEFTYRHDLDLIKRSALVAAQENDAVALSNSFLYQKNFNLAFKDYKRLNLLEENQYLTVLDIVLKKDNLDTFLVLMENGLPHDDKSNLLSKILQKKANKIFKFFVEKLASTQVC